MRRKTLGFVWGLAGAALIGVMGCTRTLYVPVTRVEKDSIYDSRVRVDSVIDRDSVWVLERGDTLVKEVWRWRMRTRQRTDTVIKVRTDTVTVTVTPAEPAKKAKKNEKPWYLKALEALVWITRAGFLIFLIYLIRNPLKKILRLWIR